MGAYATDVVEKLWPTNYGGRGTPYLSEGGFNIRDQYGNFSAPPLGYLWDFAKRAGVSVRSYGEFASWRRRGGEVRGGRPGPGGPRPSRVSAVRSRRDRSAARGHLARGVPHVRSQTASCRSCRSSGSATITRTAPRPARPRLGPWSRTTISRSAASSTRFRTAAYWKDSAIFVLEDDAQNGPDHVDAHRSVLLVDQPVLAPAGARQHALHDVGRAAHDRVDSRPAADEPVRRGGHADVYGLSADARRDPVHASAGAGVTRREERLVIAGRPGVAAHEPARRRHGAGAGAERDPLAVDSGRWVGDAAAATHGFHPPDRRRR